MLQDMSVQSVFDDWARRGRAEGMESGHGPAARQGFSALQLPAAGRYLDVGCGNGYTVRWAAQAMPQGQAHGIDISAEMIKRAQEQSREYSNAQFDCTPFPDQILEAGFDGIFSMEVFYYLPDLSAGLARVKELLAPSGRFACVVDYYEENSASHGWPEQMDLSMHLLSAAGWQSAFEDAGLRVLQQSRLKLSPADTKDDWKVSEGSLFTLGIND